MVDILVARTDESTATRVSTIFPICLVSVVAISSGSLEE